MAAWTRVWVAAGSNDAAVPRLTAAVAALARSFGPLRRSDVYRSAAVGAPAPDYLNLAIGFGTDRGPADVKRALEAIEADAGRVRTVPRGGLCALDLDLSIYGERVDPGAGLPHPDVLRRAFVLAPLAEVAPELAHPVTGERLGAAWARLGRALPPLERLGDLETLRGA